MWFVVVVAVAVVVAVLVGVWGKRSPNSIYGRAPYKPNTIFTIRVALFFSQAKIDQNLQKSIVTRFVTRGQGV